MMPNEVVQDSVIKLVAKAGVDTTVLDDKFLGNDNDSLRIENGLTSVFINRAGQAINDTSAIKIKDIT